MVILVFAHSGISNLGGESKGGGICLKGMEN